MQTFTNADRTYRDAIEAQGRELPAAFAAAHLVPQIDLSTTDITHAVLLRLKSFLLCQEKIKAELGKVYAHLPLISLLSRSASSSKLFWADLTPRLLSHLKRILFVAGAPCVPIFLFGVGKQS